ncbi:hypothetical protein LJB87_01150 [Alistipes sp. OttesenSCG-928-L06]|nr:hypothetical protein [Alistipes sp. OttesenSCG-928-L06]
MKTTKFIRHILPVVWTVLSVTACGTEDHAPEPENIEAQLTLSLDTRGSGSFLDRGSDGTLNSLALFVFTSNGTREYAELIPALSDFDEDRFSRRIRVSREDKVIYVIGNYALSGLTFSPTLSANTTLAELEALNVVSTGMSDAGVPMAGKTTAAMTSDYVEATVPLQKLAGRVDLHIFKTADMEARDVRVVSAALRNRVLNSNARYNDWTMVEPILYDTESVTFPTPVPLAAAPENLSDVTPDEAHVSFYSFQNIVPGVSRAQQRERTILSVTASIGGKEYTFESPLYDENYHDYSLLRNHVYRILAAIEREADGQLQLSAEILPWTLLQSAIGYNPLPDDYAFGVWNNDTEAQSGKVAYGQTADYSFTLNAPAGAVWMAHLDNGLHFEFTAVERGIAGTGAACIRVAPKSPAQPNEKATTLCITVNGNKLRINPLVGGSRLFEGTETDIRITQPGSK